MLVPVALALVAVSQAPFDSLRFRSIGPAVVGGRVHDVEGVPGHPSVLYVATASGGLWKSVNKGTTWTPIFDHEPVSTFGDVAIAPSNPDVVWAGTGEQNNRQSSSWGNGIYRSTDAGATWTHVGLKGTGSIGRVVLHPSDPNVAWVAAVGNLWKPSMDRGVYKTTDAGRTWSKTLFVDSLTGATEIVMDPRDPNVLHAATYQRLRSAFGFNGGGPGSAVYRSTDGGATWTKAGSGLPAGDKG
ncbi:MAG: WD40/YVTN/BNR-like repeat-containing protein, partial [Gemmatimonadales bacterium]